MIGRIRQLLRGCLRSVALRIPPIKRLYLRAHSRPDESSSPQSETPLPVGRHANRIAALSVRQNADPAQIPIIILNFNQLGYLQKQVSRLTQMGPRRLIVLDNNSTFLPLLDYYETIKDRVEVIRLERNFGKTALWDAGILDRLGIEGHFIYTDSDVIPDEACPDDLVAHLLSVLNQHPQFEKVGPALRIDNLPDHYRFKHDVMIWEGQFWKQPVARGLFMAPIDTTFALYKPRSPFVDRPALRTGWPFVARHEAWYADSSKPTDEQRHYMSTAKNTHWTLGTLPGQFAESIRSIQSSQTELLLHLGCGHDLLPGWLNIDVVRGVGADLVFDLNNCAAEKLPLKDDSVDGFFMSHVFEHIENTLAMMQELHRVAKPGAKFICRLPHGASDDASEDPTHKRSYFPNSFVYFSQPAYSRADYNYLGDWDIQRVKLVVDPQLLRSEGEAKVLERVRTQRNVVREMIVELTAIKPVRPRQSQLLRWARPTLSESSIDEETTFLPSPR